MKWHMLNSQLASVCAYVCVLGNPVLGTEGSGKEGVFLLVTAEFLPEVMEIVGVWPSTEPTCMSQGQHLLCERPKSSVV